MRSWLKVTLPNGPPRAGGGSSISRMWVPMRCAASWWYGSAGPSTSSVQSTSLLSVNSPRASEPKTTSVVSAGTSRG
jgi:hypothetical protein